MCLIVFGWKVHPRYALVLAANRDEFFDRPTLPLDYWEDHPDVLGGRDIEKGGTWLATNVDGRWAAVTNFRDGNPAAPSPLSRGHLVSDYVASRASASTYANTVAEPLPLYSGCNLLIGDATSLVYVSNRDAPGGGVQGQHLRPGVYGLSNHLLDTPWPKLRHTRHALQELLDRGQSDIADDLFEVLGNRNAAHDDELPVTGVSVERERMLSAPFIVSQDYGTRASTVLLVEHDGTLVMQERSFGSGGTELARCSKTVKGKARGQ